MPTWRYTRRASSSWFMIMNLAIKPAEMSNLLLTRSWALYAAVPRSFELSASAEARASWFW
eukprot:CAMPEP_0197437840 /NCGR_PEP_ID=MMETSP1175-20131217/4989_1 /TAXON_ID=1003142 /ORGANISM="Triceratium dubium, Strain CCMP147" /LENGTH=60 /DNA_ID=CAMNT_0042967459 /DNA_START=57 /DNA_END=236 /DNA_ORIENTATION=-